MRLTTLLIFYIVLLGGLSYLSVIHSDNGATPLGLWMGFASACFGAGALICGGIFLVRTTITATERDEESDRLFRVRISTHHDDGGE